MDSDPVRERRETFAVIPELDDGERRALIAESRAGPFKGDHLSGLVISLRFLG